MSTAIQVHICRGVIGSFKTKKNISPAGPFKCPGCDSVTFSNRRALDLHMRKIHKAGIVECDECGRKVLDLKRHKEILHKWEHQTEKFPTSVSMNSRFYQRFFLQAIQNLLLSPLQWQILHTGGSGEASSKGAFHSKVTWDLLWDICSRD